MPKLTKRVVESAGIKAAEYFLWCDELPGFGVRIYPSGRRGYLVQYRAEGRTRRAKIGLHGPVTAEEARRAALALLGQVAKGEDPAEERATRRAAMTVRELCDNYLRAAKKGLILGKKGGAKKTSTLLRDRSRIDRHILPLLGNRRVVDLSRAEVTRFMRDVAAGKTALIEKTGNLRGKAIVEGGTGAAARTMGLLGGILSFAVSEGAIERNPVHGVKRPADQRKTARLDPAAYRRLGEALAALQDEGRNAAPVTAVWLLALTGCRKGEIERLRWREVDYGGHALRLLDTKEGASVRPVGMPVLELLAVTERRGGCDYVCPGRSGNHPYGGLPGAWQRLVEAADLRGMTLHTLRHSFASTAGDLGYSEPTIASLLGHAIGSVTGRYLHHLDSVLIAAADRVARTVHNYMTAIEADRPADKLDTIDKTEAHQLAADGPHAAPSR
jgi:integrase